MTASRAVWPPEPGHFALRLAPRAWAVPARIVQDATGWWAEIDETPYPPADDPVHAPQVARVWQSAQRIPPKRYRWLLAVKAHARARDPDHPCLHPSRPIDPNQLTPLHL